MRPATRAYLLAVLLVSASCSESSSSSTTTTTVTLSNATTDAAMTTTAKANEPTTVSPIPASTSTSTAEPTRNIEEVKKIIQQHIDPNRSEHRLAVNKPTSAPQMADFAADSPEARVAEASTQFGLRFMGKLEPRSNVVLSPLSLQNLLNMLLLGTTEASASQTELIKLLGYDSGHLLDSGRLGPHEAMRSVFQSILAATHLSLAQSNELASGEPQAELLNANVDSVRAHLQTSVRADEQPLSGQLNFSMANLVLTNSDLVELRPDYERDLKTYYSVSVEQFSRPTREESKEGRPLEERVNWWVRNQTQGQIEKLAEPGDLDGEQLALVLLNAAHFKGRWLHTFNPRVSHDGTFYNGGLAQGASKVQFMRQKAVFGYADFGTAPGEPLAPSSESKTSSDSDTLLTEDAAGKSSNETSTKSPPSPPPAPTIELSREEARRLELTGKLNCSALMLPFSLNDGQELSLVLLLPAARDGLGELEAALTGPALNEIYRSLSEQQVQVELPKFAFEASHDAKAILERMGLGSIFQPQSAQLGRMFALKPGAQNQGPAKVDKVIHKAKIMVDESGAEAAAASMATIVLRNFIRPPTPIFVADHPFLFVVRHNRSNMPLFMGRVSQL